MPGKSATKFLKKHPPFSLLDDQTLRKLTDVLTLELYPAGTQILKQASKPSRGLYIIKQGSARIYAQTSPDQEYDIDFRGPGDTFGFLSTDADRLLDVSVQAISDTVCYVADKASVMKLLDERPEFSEYLMPSYFPKREEGHSPAQHIRDMLHDSSDKVLFTTPVRDLANRDVVRARADISIRDTAGLMHSHHTSSLVIVDQSDRPVGIITDKDLRDKVLVQRVDPGAPVGDIMSAQLVMIEGSDFCYQAALKMISHDVHHLLVMDAGRLSGIVSSHDFMVMQVTSSLMIVREVENQSSVEGLASSSGKIMGLISLLLGEGARASSIIRIITNINDQIERKILDFAVKTLGPPPVPFCWIIYGSAGRKEQTFKTDQDNAIIFRDPQNEEEALRAETYFGRLAEFVEDAFLRCGFALCPGDFMATNRRWRQPLSVWKGYFIAWIDTPTDEAIHDAANLFEFRGLYGDMSLAAELKTHLMNTMKKQKIFLKAMADLTTDYRPPIGLFGSFITEKSGDHANQLDLKKSCLTPLNNIIRLFSFEYNIAETSTSERIDALRTVHPTVKAAGDDLAHAFEFISLLRIRHQLERVSMDLKPDNFINPKKLKSLEQRNLKEICKLISGLLDDIEKKYCMGAQL